MRRELLRSPAFARDMRAWLKSRRGAAVAIEGALQQLSEDAYHPSLRTHKLRGPLAGVGRAARDTICASSSSSCSTRVPRRSYCSPWARTIRSIEIRSNESFQRTRSAGR
jgi:hypothetical protein